MRERDETAGGSETAPEHLLLPGRVLVASDGDSFVDLRVSSPPAEGVLTARARRGALSAGRALHARTWDGSRAWRLGLTVDPSRRPPTATSWSPASARSRSGRTSARSCARPS